MQSGIAQYNEVRKCEIFGGTGKCATAYAPFIDALTDDRRHIKCGGTAIQSSHLSPRVL